MRPPTQDSVTTRYLPNGRPVPVKKKRVVKQHIYRGVSFYSANGGSLGPKQQQHIVTAAQKIPAPVWNRLAQARTKIIIMQNREGGLHPLMREYLSAIGIPRKAQSSLSGEKDIAFTDAGRHPVAIVGIGTLPKLPNGEPRPTYGNQEGMGHILLHETAHTLDTSFQVMKALGAAYGGLERKTFRTQARFLATHKAQHEEPMSVVAPRRTQVSNTKAWRQSLPNDFTAGYGNPSRQYDRSDTYPRSEVFAESLARYWDKRKLPPKVQGFFEDYFTNLFEGGM